MYKLIGRKLLAIKSGLTTLGKQEPLSKFSLCVIVILDLFLLNIIFDGLSEHTNQLASVYEYIPNTCREAVVSETWQKENRLDNLHRVVNSYNSRSLYTNISNSDYSKVYDKCIDIEKGAQALYDDKDITDLFRILSQYKTKERALNEKIGKVKDSYFIAKSNEAVNVSSINSEALSKAEELNAVIEKIRETEESLNNNSKIKSFWQTLETANSEYRDDIISEIRIHNFWFPVKKLFWQLLFLIPIFAVGYFWNARSLKKGNEVQTLVSSHLILIASVPIVSKVIEILLDIIPHKLLQDLWDFMVSIHLTALWHYAVILLTISGALFVIYIVQKKVFNKEALRVKRLGKGLCLNCGKKLPINDVSLNYCPYCGENHKAKCEKCGEMTYRDMPYCHICGNKSIR